MGGEQGACFLLLNPPEFAELWECVCRKYLALELPHLQGVVGIVQGFWRPESVPPWCDFGNVIYLSEPQFPQWDVQWDDCILIVVHQTQRWV